MMSIFVLCVLTTLLSLNLTLSGMKNFGSVFSLTMMKMLFPLEKNMSNMFFTGFLLIASMNLMSLVCFSYPLTTTLAFNMSFSFSLWLISMLFLLNKPNSMGSFLPMNSPWYLVTFLSVVELISILVRPITLCFRLLANMSAGHILLSLICKLPFFTWMLGTVFGILELLVAIVQSFVFFMLISVYFEEGFHH